MIPGSTQSPARSRGWRSARHRCQIAVWIVFFFALLCGIGAQAQISPGPLARPHKSLEGATQCVTCHKFGAGEASFKCVECHTEIGSRLTSHRGLHPNLVTKPGSQDCVRCHSDHAGENFNMVPQPGVWDPRPQVFDHNKTGYQLLGKHQGLACNQCHKAERVSPSERSTIKVKDLNHTYLGLSQACGSCHKDPHEGRLGQDCAKCHSFNDWKVSNQFDHSKTRYPLTGLHEKVACAKCHTNGADGKPRWAGIPFGKCDDCHKDPHHGSFTQSCATCHTTASWKRVPAGTLLQNFDHGKTKYPLVGKHKTVDCIACHANGDFKKHLVFAKCIDCHTPSPHGTQFVKRKDGGECAACHNLDGWKPSTFKLKEHQETAYPLKGGHARLRCEQCHLPKGKDTLYKMKFARCMDCHKDDHAGQFAAAPYMNRCEECHTLEGYKPSTFTLAKHKKTRFDLTGSHVATPCNDCHKLASPLQTKAEIPYHWNNLDCTTCHQDVHKGEFRERQQKLGADGRPLGCEACHGTKTWRDLNRFDHDSTKFPLVGSHRGVQCIDCHKPPGMETRLLNVDFRKAPHGCQDCHEDVHAAQFTKIQRKPDCDDCHNSNRWKPSIFDHETRTTFSLKGAHEAVRCGDCHKLAKVVAGKTVVFYNPTPKDCAACHGPNIPPKKS